MRVLIAEDGLSSYVLPAVRSLGAAGWTVALAGPRRSRSAGSRWVTRTHLVPAVEDDHEGFVDGIARAVSEHGYDVVFGGDDVEVLGLSVARDRLGTVFPYAPHDQVLRAIDKLGLTQAADAVGMATPATAAADDDAVARTVLPVVVKARLHWAPGATVGRGRVAAALCTTREQVVAAVEEARLAGREIVLQEVVDGDLVAVTALCAPGGQVLARSQQRATRLSPLLRTSTRARTEPVDPALAAQVDALLAELRWTGIANLQLLAPADGPPRLIDLNGRFYGSLALALAAGLDLPVWWTLLATGSTVEVQPPAAVGVRYSALEHDLQRARTERRGGLLADLADSLRAARGAAHSTWDRHDLRPSADRVVHLAAELAQRRAGRG